MKYIAIVLLAIITTSVAFAAQPSWEETPLMMLQRQKIEAKLALRITEAQIKVLLSNGPESDQKEDKSEFETLMNACEARIKLLKVEIIGLEKRMGEEYKKQEHSPLIIYHIDNKK